MKSFALILIILFLIVVLILGLNFLVMKYVPINSKLGQWWNRHVTSYTDMDFTDDEKESR